MQHILPHLYPHDEVCGCLHISHLWPMNLYLWSTSIHEWKNVSSNWSIEQTRRPRQADGVSEQGWMKKWNLPASWIFMPTLFYVALKCPSWMKALELFGWNQTDFIQMCFDRFYAAGKGFRVWRSTAKQSSLQASFCLCGRKDGLASPCRIANCEIFKWRRKIADCCFLLLRWVLVMLLFQFFPFLESSLLCFLKSLSAMFFYLMCLLWGFLVCCAEWRNARRMSGDYVPPVHVPDLHSDEKDDDLPPLSPSQTQHLLDHGGSMSSAAAVQQHPPQQQQQAAFHWTSGICACFDNMPVCMSLLFCYCCFPTYKFLTCAQVMIRFQFLLLLVCITWE